MAQANYYCEECVEEVAPDDVFWENNRAYCGRCGSELDLDEDAADVVEQMTHRRTRSPVAAYDENEEEDEEEDLDSDDLDEEEGDDEDEFGEIDEDLDEEDDRPSRS